MDQRFLRLQHRRHHHLPWPHLFRQGARHVLHGVDPVADFPIRADASERGSRAAILGVCNLPDHRVHDRAAYLGAVRRHVSLRAISRRVGGPCGRRRADSRPCDDRVSVRDGTHRRTVAAVCVFTAFYLLATSILVHPRRAPLQAGFWRDGRCSTITRSSWSPRRSESTPYSNCPWTHLAAFSPAPRSPSQSCSLTTGAPSEIRSSSVTRRSSSRPPRIVNSPSKRSDSSV